MTENSRKVKNTGTPKQWDLLFKFSVFRLIQELRGFQTLFWFQTKSYFRAIAETCVHKFKFQCRKYNVFIEIPLWYFPYYSIREIIAWKAKNTKLSSKASSLLVPGVTEGRGININKSLFLLFRRRKNCFVKNLMSKHAISALRKLKRRFVFKTNKRNSLEEDSSTRFGSFSEGLKDSIKLKKNSI